VLIDHGQAQFLGFALNNLIGGKAGMLLWGTAYGLFLGAGLGVVLHIAQVTYFNVR